MKIPITKPYFDDQEKKAIITPLETGWIVQGPYVKKFEELFAEFTKARYAKATTNCTTALHLALDAIGIKPGEKVIIPSFTYIATANAVEQMNAIPIFCDIDLQTFNIDTLKLAEILENDKYHEIKAIIPVNLFGLCADLIKISEIAHTYDIKIIEDSACGFGAYINNKHSGTFGDIGCFSFHPRKSITTGEGGMIITNDEKIAEMVSSLRDHGASKSDLTRHRDEGGSLLPEFNIKGFNYRMTDIQGAIGVSQMNKAEEILEIKSRIAEKYNRALKHIDKLIIPYIPDGFIHGYQSYVCLLTLQNNMQNITLEDIDKINIVRNNLMAKLETAGIATRQGTHAVHTLGYYKNKYEFREEDFIKSYAADRLSMALPLYPSMTDDELDYVITNLTKALY